MASELVIASVTAVLKHLLENGLADRNVLSAVGADAVVSAMPPDRIATGETERPQLNIFLYHVTPFARLGRTDGQTAGGAGEPPRSALSVDLHYLLSAYGAQDLQAELLLGFALRLFHQHPLIEREEIRQSLARQSSPDGGRVLAPAYLALARSSLPETVERIRLTPEFPSLEDLSRLWSSLQAHYRPSTAYKVSAIVMDR